MNSETKTKLVKTNKRQFDAWLNTAIYFSVWHCSDKKHVIKARDFIFKELGEEYRRSTDKSRDKAMLMSFMLNLWAGFCNGTPIQISQNKNKFSNNAAYGKAFFSYRRTRRLLEKLIRKGYVQKKRGYFYTNDCKETRIWGTEKLLRLFLDVYGFRIIGDIYQDKDFNLVQLNEKTTKIVKGKEKEYTVPVEFDPTEATIRMKDNLSKYNQLVENEEITIVIKAEDLIKPKVLTETILAGLNSGAIELIRSELYFKDPEEKHSYVLNQEESVLPKFSIIPELIINKHSYKQFSYSTLCDDNEDHVEPTSIEHTLITITNTMFSQQWRGIQPDEALFLYLLWQKRLFNSVKVRGKNPEEQRIKKRLMMREERPLIDFGIKHLEFRIKKKSLYRVFNEGSLDFDKGGRFYGAFYHQLPESVRNCIKINGNDTIEIDYSGMHLRMLYNQLGIDYRKDPYMIGRKRERTKYKFVSLISINAEKEDAPGAIYDCLKKQGIKYRKGKGSIKKMMDAFKEYHAPVKEFLFTGKGLELQNDDSCIMENILMELHELGITGLPIHDSVIVEKEHADLLEKLMIESKYSGW